MTHSWSDGLATENAAGEEPLTMHRRADGCGSSTRQPSFMLF